MDKKIIRKNRLQMLHDIILQLSAESSTELITLTVLKSVTTLIDSEASAVYLFDRKSHSFHGFFYNLHSSGNRPDEITPCQLSLTEQELKSLKILSPHNHTFEKLSSQFRKFGYITKTAVCAPLFIQGHFIGLLLALNRKKGTFCKTDSLLLETFSFHVNHIVEKIISPKEPLDIRRLEQELEMAKIVQESFLPELKDVKWGFCEFGAHKQAAFNVSGDFYDLFPVMENKYFFLFGDVSGKGIPAALMMVHLLSRIRYLVFRFQKATRIVHELNNEICSISRRGMFATMICGFADLDARELEFVNCGHIPLLHFKHASGKWEITDSEREIPLGINKNALFHSRKIRFLPKDAVLMVSDGVTDTRDESGTEFSLEKVRDLLPEKACAPQKLVDTLFEYIDSHRKSDFKDDVTLFSINNSLIECKVVKVHPNMHGFDKIRTSLDQFYKSHLTDQSAVPALMRAIPLLLFYVNSKDTAPSGEKVWEIKMTAKVSSVEIGIRTYGESYDAETIRKSDAFINLSRICDELILKELQGGLHLMIVNRA